MAIQRCFHVKGDTIWGQTGSGILSRLLLQLGRDAQSRLHHGMC